MFGIGEAGALGAAMLWAVSSIIFGQTRLTAWQLNSAKNAIGCICGLCALIVISMVSGYGMSRIPLADLGMLALSSLVGLTIGDTFFFRSLQILGPRRALVMATTVPVFGALLGWVMIGETLTLFSAFGMVIAMTGISFVVMERKALVEAPGLYPGKLVIGLLAGLLASFCQAFGGTISKIGMDNCTALEATFLRLATAVVVAVVFMSLRSELRKTIDIMTRPEILKRIIPASMIGTWLGIWCSQIGFKFTSVAIASTLLVTTPMFAVPIIRVIHGHRVSWLAMFAKVVTVIGILLVVAKSFEQLIGLFAFAGS